MSEVLVHGTAIVVGSTGLILVGPSGAGKSSLALAILNAARRADHFAALVSDDQVLIRKEGKRIIARGPAAIFGLIEVRGSGIGHFRAVSEAVMMQAVAPITLNSSNRIPPDGLRAVLSEGIDLPLLPIDRTTIDPFGVLEAMLPGFPGHAI